MTYYTLFPSAIDDIAVLTDGKTITGIYMDNHKHMGENRGFMIEGIRNDSITVLMEARRQLEAFFAGELKEFDLPLSMKGTPFQSMVWEGLKAIPYGETISYGEFARRLGVPNASRAVGLANGKNPISIVVPCHRVIGANGKLTGYGGGLPRKHALLELEARGVGQGSLL